LLQYQDKRCYIRVGRKCFNKSFEVEAYIHLVLITGDSKSQDYLSGTSSRKKFLKCRCCMMYDCITPSSKIRDDIIFRDDVEMNEVGKYGYKGLLLKLNMKKTIASNRLEYKKITQQINDINKRMSDLNCAVGDNPLYMSFRWQRERGINSFHSALPPDYLHTINKGPVECCIAWCVACIMATAEIDKINYGSNMATLDTKISFFQIIRVWIFVEGIITVSMMV
jgi:hypothetical protein